MLIFNIQKCCLRTVNCSALNNHDVSSSIVNNVWRAFNSISRLCFLSLSLLFTPAISQASVVISHIGDVNPTTEGWTANFHTTVSGMPGANDTITTGCDSPCPYWRINDPSTASNSRGNYTYSIQSSEMNHPQGWSLHARMRRAQVTTGVGEIASYAVSFFLRGKADGSTNVIEFGAQLALTATSGKQVLRILQDGGTFKDIGLGAIASYKDIEIIYDPVNKTADYLLDGKPILTNYSGYIQPATHPQVVFWGSGSSGDTGRSFWNKVEFITAPDTDGDGLTNMNERHIHGTDPYNADGDNDGASDGEEIAVGSDPFKADTDNDGLLDGVEIKYGFSPTINNGDATNDADNDGLTNLEEQQSGTNPLEQDSDGDGLSDNDEVNFYKTDPLKTDTDGDTLSDLDEITIYNSNPIDVDSDRDELNDADEINTYGTSAFLADTDEDGLTDGSEIKTYKTSPTIKDTDEDGLLDGFEVNYQLDPLITGDELLDNDNDGLDSLAEQTAGSNPLVADSDGDGLTDSEEVLVYFSYPTNKDSDGDGLSDDYEILHNFEINLAGDDLLDADNDGLTNLEEQNLGTHPHNTDTDNDGEIDGQEVNITHTNPLISDRGDIPARADSALKFEANSQPLFITPPPQSRINLIPQELYDKLKAENLGTNTYGRVETVNGEVPLWALQDAWDQGWAACKTTRSGTTHKACANYSFTPGDSLCRNGGTVDVLAISVECCTVPVINTFNKDDEYANGCTANSKDTYTLAYLDEKYACGAIPDSIDIPQGLGSRPTVAPPPGSYSFKAGAEVTVDVDVSADLVISAESEDPGEFNIEYVTDVAMLTNKSSVQPGEIFNLWLTHQPRMADTHMSSKWSAIGFSARYEITGGARATAELWSIDPAKAAQYPDPDFQMHETVTVFDDTINKVGEFVGFTAAASDIVQFRFMNGVEYVPEWTRDKIFKITPDLLDFSNTDLVQSIPEGTVKDILSGTPDVIPPGTALPISIPNFLAGSKCPFGFLKHPLLCLGLTLNPKYLGVSQELAHLRFQLPEINTPVSEDFWGGNAYDNLIKNEFIQIEPKRAYIEADGSLVNTVPNGTRPFRKDYSGGLWQGLTEDKTILSSDTIRFQWDIDGTFPTSYPVLFEKSIGNAWWSLRGGLFDVDVELWAGLDQTLTFEPGLEAELSFSQPVMVRLASENPLINEALATWVGMGETKTVAANVVIGGVTHATDFDSVTTGTDSNFAWLEITQPDIGDLVITASYGFKNNSFTNKTDRVITIAPSVSAIVLGVGGIAGSVISAATGVSEIRGNKVSLDVFPKTRVALGDKFNEQSEVIDELGNVIGPRSVPGAMTALGGQSSLTIFNRGTDTDEDGLPDSVEQISCTNELDRDSDDDGIGDGIEDVNRNGIVDTGETDPCNADTDGDGIQDGTERGAMVGISDPDGNGPILATDLSVFIPDPDPTLRTDPTVANNFGGESGSNSGGSGGGALLATELQLLLLVMLILRCLRYKAEINRNSLN